MSDDQNTPDAVELATALTIAWLGNHNTRATSDDVPAFLDKMHQAMTALMAGGTNTDAPAPTESEHTPAVSVRKSLASKDHIISMIDGKPYKTLRRHLSSNGLSPEEYRARYGLKKDYPMVAESYSTSRREMAHKIGLGRKSGQKVAPGGEAAEKPTKAPRRTKAKTVAADA